MNKKDLSERDICSKFISSAVKRAGWDGMMQIREEVNFTKGRIIVRGKLVTVAFDQPALTRRDRVLSQVSLTTHCLQTPGLRQP
jgi:type I site-specific restriction endonuclease